MNIEKESAVSVVAAHIFGTLPLLPKADQASPHPADVSFGPFDDQARELAIQTIAHCSSVITAYSKILSGEKPTARETLVRAESEGRDYFGDMGKKMADLIARRVAAAEYLVANGQRMRKIGEYRAAAKVEPGSTLGVAGLRLKGAPGAPLGGVGFQPAADHSMACLVGEPGQIADIYLIEPSAEHPGFFFLSHLSDCGAAVDYLTRPIRADFVTRWLRAEGLADPAGAEWRSHPCAGVHKAGQSLHPALEAA